MDQPVLRPYRLLKRERLSLGGLELDLDRVARPDGRELVLRRLHARDSVYVVPLTAEGQVVLVRQWRQALERFTLEIVAGAVDEGETPAEAAERELAEEVGQQAESLEELAVIQLSPGLFSARQHFYLARGCTLIADWRDAAHEPTEPWPVSSEQAFAMSAREIDSGDSALALLLAERALRG
jgi:ADP-ribose pyrophosphatase